MKPQAVALALVLACSGNMAHAAPTVSDAFFLGRARTADATLSIAGDERGFVLSWDDGGSIRFQLFGPGAVLTGSPRTLEKTTGTSFFNYSTTVPSDPRAIALESGYAVAWDDSKTETSPPTFAPILSTSTPTGVLIDRMGATKPFMFEGVSSMLPSSATMTSTDNGFVTVESHAVASSSGVSGTESMRFYDEVGENTASLDVPISTRPPTTLFPVGVASNGSSVLFAWVDNDGLRFGLASRTAIEVVMGNALTQATRRLSLASNGKDYLVVWRTETGSTVAVRVGGDGTVLDSDVIALAAALPAGDSMEAPAVAAAGTTYLVVTTGSDDVVRGVRVPSDGSLLDRTGFLVSMATHPSLSRAGDAMWLVAPLGDDGIIRGRFIGEGALPATPDNVEPPPEADAGATSSGELSTPTNPGNASDAGSASSPGGVDGGTDAPTTDAGRNSGPEHARARASSGCDLVASRHGTSFPSGFSTLLLLSLLRHRRARCSAPRPPAPATDWPGGDSTPAGASVFFLA